MFALKRKETMNPLSTLYQSLKTDMDQVNALILENMQSNVQMIPALAGYLIASGGKRIRPLLTLACNRLYGDESARPYPLAAAVEFIHTATLLHDDVVDESLERRGKEAANLVFGNQASVLVGDFLFSRAFQLMVSHKDLEVLRILSDASAIIAQGEVLQLSTQNNLDTSYKQYEDMISAKTAALFAAACEIGPIIAGQSEQEAKAMRDYGLNLGLAFQVADDVLDYSANAEQLGKTIGDDFREGKITAPVLIALENANTQEQDFWKRTLADQKQNANDLKTAQDILLKHDAFQRSISFAHTYVEEAIKALSGTPQSPLRTTLEDIAAFTVERDF